jgi:hypothetical protein
VEDAELMNRAEEWGVDLRRARMAGKLRPVLRAVRIAYDYKLIPPGSPLVPGMKRRYQALVEQIGYDPIP